MAVHMSPNTTVPAETARVARAVFPKGNAVRAGVEGTLTQGTRVCGLRRARYIGQAKTHLQHLLTAVVLNLARFVAWVQDVPLAPTRTSSFAALAQS